MAIEQFATVNYLPPDRAVIRFASDLAPQGGCEVAERVEYARRRCFEVMTVQKVWPALEAGCEPLLRRGGQT